MKTVCFSETLVSTCKSTQHHNQKNNTVILTTVRTSNLTYKRTVCYFLDQNSVRKLSITRFCVPFLLYFYALYSLVKRLWVCNKNTYITKLFATFLIRIVLGKFQLHDFAYLFDFISVIQILLLKTASLKQICTYKRIICYFSWPWNRYPNIHSSHVPKGGHTSKFLLLLCFTAFTSHWKVCNTIYIKYHSF
jgi:hypothetical protein